MAELAARLYDDAQRPRWATAIFDDDDRVRVGKLAEIDKRFWGTAHAIVERVTEAMGAPDTRVLERLEAARRVLDGLPPLDDVAARRRLYLRRLSEVAHVARHGSFFPTVVDPEGFHYHSAAYGLRSIDPAFAGMTGDTLWAVTLRALAVDPRARRKGGASHKAGPLYAAELAVFFGALGGRSLLPAPTWDQLPRLAANEKKKLLEARRKRTPEEK